MGVCCKSPEFLRLKRSDRSICSGAFEPDLEGGTRRCLPSFTNAIRAKSRLKRSITQARRWQASLASSPVAWRMILTICLLQFQGIVILLLLSTDPSGRDYRIWSNRTKTRTARPLSGRENLLAFRAKTDVRPERVNMARTLGRLYSLLNRPRCVER